MLTTPIPRDRRNVWFCVPSARPAAEANVALDKWRAMGYRIAIFDESDEVDAKTKDAYITGMPYPGYAKAVNLLVKAVLLVDKNCDWIVTGGDDTYPDPDHLPRDIAYDCADHFAVPARRGPSAFDNAPTFGIMQPTGDRFADGCIDRICGSPWMGREFCERINQGNGPMWPEYRHMFPDEELFEVAKSLGVLWQRRDLVHYHNHFMRANTSLTSHAVSTAPPPFLREANSPQHWAEFKGKYTARKAANFPGHEPLMAVTA